MTPTPAEVRTATTAMCDRHPATKAHIIGMRWAAIWSDLGEHGLAEAILVTARPLPRSMSLAVNPAGKASPRMRKV